MARNLDRDAKLGVLRLDDLTITRGDVADAIRAMPASFASLGSDGVYKHATEVLIRQKAMVLNARRQGLDKDPALLHRGEIALERIVADAWLARKANAAVTEEALHARYERDVAGKPGPDEARARVILVPTPDEARALIARLRAGADFAELALQHSKDPTASRGGDLGYVPLEAVSPEVGSAMFTLFPARSRRSRCTPWRGTTFRGSRDGGIAPLPASMKRVAGWSGIFGPTPSVQRFRR